MEHILLKFNHWNNGNDLNFYIYYLLAISLLTNLKELMKFTHITFYILLIYSCFSCSNNKVQKKVQSNNQKEKSEIIQILSASMIQFTNTLATAYETKDYTETINDLPFGTYFRNEIKSVNHDSINFEFAQAKLFTTFCNMIAIISKDKAKRFSDEKKEFEEIHDEYIGYLNLQTNKPITSQELITNQFKAIKSIAFYLKVSKVPKNKDLYELVDHISNLVDEKFKTLNEKDALKVGIYFANYTFCIALADYSYLLDSFLKSPSTQSRFEIESFMRNNNQLLAYSDPEYYSQLNMLTKQISNIFTRINATQAELIRNNQKK